MRLDKVALFDQYGFLGGGQVVLLSAIRAACDVARHVIVVIPLQGALEGSIRTMFGNAVSLRGTASPNLTHGRKSFRDAMRLAVHSLGFVCRHARTVADADLIYANGPRQFPALMFLAVLLRTPCCYHVHIELGRRELQLLRFASRLTSTHRIIFSSAFIRDQIAAQAPSLARSEKVVVIENALGSGYHGMQFVDRFPAPIDVINVLVMGVLRPEKGQDVAVCLARRLSFVRLHIVGRVGEGAEAWVEHLRATASVNVTFHPAVSDPSAFIAEVGIQVMLVPSQWQEPFGLVCIEGMANSCITVVSNRGALPQIAAKTGALVYGDSSDDLVNCFRALMRQDLDRLRTLARSQFEATMREYHPQRLVVELSDMLATSSRKRS